ncbi:hypothetical protein DOTSEDRAFT_18877 [Dothistroma septosporum NZE10]|uniref:Uncharacterized protein n=1 Tax=Dothistroma septosporum (strain NZE10 / CBS 128990) TaxID=675120 RepID=N1PXS7_DOTSN|nr:hypothetical protein DOTSEDRAFT_18877 [Dothistroma septosporum NZE10]
MDTSSTARLSWHNFRGIMADVNRSLLFAFLIIWTLLLAYFIAWIFISGRPSTPRLPSKGLWSLLIRREIYIVSLHDFAEGECVIAGAFLSQADARSAITQMLEVDYRSRQLWCDDITHAALENTEEGILIKLPQGYDSFSGVMAAIHRMSLR